MVTDVNALGKYNYVNTHTHTHTLNMVQEEHSEIEEEIEEIHRLGIYEEGGSRPFKLSLDLKQQHKIYYLKLGNW